MTQTRQKPPRTARVVVVNAYANNRRPRAFARWLRRLDYDFALISECSPKVAPHLRRIGTLYAGSDTSRGAREVAVLIRTPDKVGRRKHRTRQVSEYVSRPFAPDRWLTRVREHDHVLYSLHGNAVIQNKGGMWNDTMGAHVWRTQGYPEIQRMIVRDLVKDRGVVAGGDMNAAEGPAGGPDPGRFFKDCGLDYTHAGLMYLAYSGEVWRIVQRQVLPTPPGADAHKVLVIDLGAVRGAST